MDFIIKNAHFYLIEYQTQYNFLLDMQQLNLARGQAAYISLAQKYDKHIKDFNNDPNTQYRWIWQLIQNAKDAPNMFEKVKIKQKLSKNSFESSHNGDPFTIKQLHSIVGQYSTKLQKNNQNMNITGKYGTGFITTFIISRIVQLSGIFKFQFKNQEQDEIKQVKDAQQVQQIQQISKNKKGSKGKAKQTKDKNAKSQKLINAINQIENFHFQKFSIEMDRTYQQRDEELVKKIKSTERKLDNIIADAQYLIRHNKHSSQIKEYMKSKRNVDSYDTKFIYKNLTDRKAKLIQNTITNVNILMPYALIFNSNLAYYEFISQNPSSLHLSFAVQTKKIKPLNKQGIFLFEYEYLSNYNLTTNKFENTQMRHLVAFGKSQSNILAAIPISIKNQGKKNQQIKIERIFNLQTETKVFKDFPLIGCKDIKWNAMINSKSFYPDQKRGGLLMNTKQQDSTSHKQQIAINNKQLLSCYEGINKLYIFLSTYCQKGRQNLLIMTNENILNINQKQFDSMIKKSIKQIVTHPFIPTTNNKFVSPSKLNFIQLSGQKYQLTKKTQHDYLSNSKKINQIFKFLYKQQQCLSQQNYKDYAQILSISRPYRMVLQKNQSVKFLTLDDCLILLQKLSFNQFAKLMKKQIVQNKLAQIYTIIRQVNVPFKNYKIFLNQNNQFKSFEKDLLKIKKIPPIYEQISKYVGINLDRFLMNEQLSKIIPSKDEQLIFNIQKMQQMLTYHFQSEIYSQQKINFFIVSPNQQNKNLLQTLYQLIITYDMIPTQTINLINQFTVFKKLQKFKLFNPITQLKKPSKKTWQSLKNVFVNFFSTHISKFMQQTGDLNKFFIIFVENNFDQIIGVLRLLFHDSLLKESLCKIPLKISCSYKFINQSRILKFPSNLEYPNQKDKQVYEILYKEQIDDKLILKIYPQQGRKNVAQTNYITLFQRIEQKYNGLALKQKQIVLQYAKQLYDKNIQVTSSSQKSSPKYLAWVSFINLRVKKIFDIKYESRRLQKENVKDFLYDLLNDGKNLQRASQLYVKNNRKIDFIFDKQQELNEKPVKKLKKN